VYPRPLQDPLPVWVAVGGSPESAYRAGALGLPMALAIIGGLPERFVPFTEIHRRAAAEAGHEGLPLSINSHGLIADSASEAIDVSFASVKPVMDKIGRERGWPPLTRESYEAAATLRGANFVGNPEQIVEKILYQQGLFAHDRFLLQLSVGTLPHAQIMRAIELFGTVVAPAVRRELAPSLPHAQSS
jgi:alkanesulfonate monooxygenase SsuD/methylene tetrahydromethanopterin reductase-like flavin-dependent oxidoreductase (luciferase family)